MTEPESGTLTANPEQVPAVQPEAPQPIRHATETQKSDARRAAFEKAAATVGKPAPGATPEPAKADGPPTFFKKAEEPPAFDPSKLPPELQPVYKSMQADATRKWEEAAQMRRELTERQAKLDEERKLMLDGQKSLIEALQKSRTGEPPAETLSTKEQIQQLRDEGRHGEADELVLKYVEQLAEAKAEPLVREAKENLYKTTFRETLAQVRMENPIAAHYWDKVSEVFDGNTPQMVTLRKAVMQSPEAMKTFMPFVIDYLASREHNVALEQQYEAAVKAGIEKGIAERRAVANKVPSQLIKSGSTSMDSGPGKIDLKEAFRLAREAS